MNDGVPTPIKKKFASHEDNSALGVACYSWIDVGSTQLVVPRVRLRPVNSSRIVVSFSGPTLVVANYDGVEQRTQPLT